MSTIPLSLCVVHVFLAALLACHFLLSTGFLYETKIVPDFEEKKPFQASIGVLVFFLNFVILDCHFKRIWLFCYNSVSLIISLIVSYRFAFVESKRDTFGSLLEIQFLGCFSVIWLSYNPTFFSGLCIFRPVGNEFIFVHSTYLNFCQKLRLLRNLETYFLTWFLTAPFSRICKLCILSCVFSSCFARREYEIFLSPMLASSRTTSSKLDLRRAFSSPWDMSRVVELTHFPNNPYHELVGSDLSCHECRNNAPH